MFLKISKFKIITILSLLSLISILFILRKTNAIKKEVAETDNKSVATFKEVKVGDPFNNEEITKKLGLPVSTQTDSNITINEYNSSNEYRFNQIKIENEEISFIKEVINIEDGTNSDSIRKKYGIADYILFEKESDSYFDLYVYLRNGIAYIGHEDGTLLEIWYFEPTDIDTFISRYAPNYQKEPFEEQTGH